MPAFTRRRACGLLAGLLALGGASAQDETAEDEPVVVDPITVSAPRVERALQETPAAVTVVDGETFREGRQRLALDEALNRVPGLYFQNRYNFAQNLRLSTRGFGARAPFGIRGIRIRVDGFPETLPDGQSQIDAVDLDSITRAEVVRGPSSVLYGNATGGVIDLSTATGREDPGTSVTAEAGSYDFYKLAARQGGVSGPWAYHVSASALDYEGYREQSETRKRLGNFSVSRELGGDRRLRAVLTVLDNPESEDPSALTLEEVREDRRQARDIAVTLDSGQEVEQQRLGLIYEDADAAGGQLTLRGFYTRRDFEQQLPFPGNSLLGFDRDFFGVGAEYARSASLFGQPFRYVTGVEVDRQIDDRDRFSVDGTGTQTGRTQEEEQQATASGAFLQGDLDVTDRLTASLGARVDRVRFEVDDRFLGDGRDDTGSRTFEEVSGSAGLLYRLTPDHSLYATVSTAFETPTFTEFAKRDGTGGLSEEIDPQEAFNREIGARGFLADSVRYEVAVFSVAVDDELIVDGDVDGRDFYENAGATSRDGLEIGLEWFATDAFTVNAAYTYGRYRFDRFVDVDGNDFAGNRIPGLPRHQLYLEGLWEGSNGWYAALDGQIVGPVFADNANDVEVSGYGVWNLRGGREWGLSGGRRVEVFGGVNNLFDKEYFANIRANAFGGRYYEPAPEANAYVGATLTF
ncbi:TonB-dependent receptor family protein [Spiribacter halobius]|uniref:TonB-dependent receptor n=1 Tax=Sediminicurvatus halobius TaxID=2182432 RepID=A0A2U2N581_9GAMM|nr:TonB-dependent receptor [Spiribacter halobius]PWG64270.1 TonB-dependent receptor [Spiribacter halobius]UEX79392.1 TonB-dependent receptor [Spiribacter halobius]